MKSTPDDLIGPVHNQPTEKLQNNFLLLKKKKTGAGEFGWLPGERFHIMSPTIHVTVDTQTAAFDRKAEVIFDVS